MEDDKRARDLGELIAKRMMEENPKLIRDVRKLVSDKVTECSKPWYARLYESFRNIFYGYR